MNNFFCMFFLGALGCSAAGDNPPDGFDPNYLDLKYTPEPGAEDLLDKALDILKASTGANFRAGPNGIPVQVKEEVWSLDTPTEPSHRLCGLASISFVNERPGVPKRDVDGLLITYKVSIEIENSAAPDCWTAERSVVHEIIHTVRRKIVPPGSSAVDHTAHGVFQALSAPDDRVDVESLLKICEAIECEIFNPETD